MAVSVSFFLAYSKPYILANALEGAYVGIRCEIRYTPDSLPWALSRSLDRKVERIQFMLDIRAIPKFWVHGRANNKHPDAPQINARIDGIAQRAIRLHSEYIDAGEIPSKGVYTLDILGRCEVPQAGGFFEDYERYVKYCEGRTSKAFAYAQRLTMRRVKEFERWRGLPTAYGSINKTWGSEFAAWLMENRKGKKIAHNTGNKHLKMLKMFLNHATLEGWNTAVFYKQIKIIEKRNAFPIALSEQEVLSLWAIKDDQLDHLHSKERRVILDSRDWFVLATQTALRFSDWDPDRITTVNADGGGKNFRLYQKKTINPIEIPLSDLAERVLARHGGIMPRPLTPAPTLKHIVHLCQVAGIKKHITTHTARRTFATLQESAGVPRSIIMRITGHRTERDYLKYVGITFEHNAAMLRRANPDWFKSGTA